MQKLTTKLKNVPTDASLVCISTRLVLNRGESPSVQKNRNGYAPSIRKQRYSTKPGDLVRFIGSNKIFVVKGMHSYGKYVRVCDKEKILNFKTDKIIKCYHQKTLKWI